MNQRKIVIVGSCNTDMVVKSNRLPTAGETVLGGTFLMNPGGKGANQAVAVARMGGDVTFVCKIGTDFFGDQSLDLYQEEGIDTTYVFRDAEVPSGVALVTVDARGENCIVVAPGANNALSIEDVEFARNEIESAELLLLQLEIPIDTVLYAAQIAHAKGVKVVLNPAPAPTTPLSEELIQCVDVIIPNRTEASVLTGLEVYDWADAEHAAKILYEKGIGTVIITLGAEGVLCCKNGQITRVDAFKVDAVDTTAAGDTFCGAFCEAFLEGADLKSAVRFAALVSSVSVTRMGAQSSIPSRQEVDTLSKKLL